MNLAILPTPTAVLAVQSAPSFTTASPGRGRGYSKQGQSRHCTHCGRNNHTVDTCFAKHGYPPGWKSKKASVNQISATTSLSEELNSSAVSEALFSLSKDQLANLIALLPNAKPIAIVVSSANLVSSHNIYVQPSSGTAPWLLDSGTTDHFTCSLHWFSSFQSIKSVPVSLPNGKTVVAFYKGTIVLTDSLILHNVLYVEHFSVNIISVTKLTKALDCRAVFTHNLCFLQMNTCLKIIGTAKEFKVTHDVHIINMLPTPLLNNHSPHFHVYHAHPDLSNLRVFGTLCFASTLQAHKTKFQSRAKKCIYLGHPFGTKGFLLFDLHTREIFVSRHVIFYETIFPYHDHTSSFSVDSIFPPNLPVIDINSDVIHSAPISSIPLTESNSSGTEAPIVVSSSIDDHSVSAPSSPISASLPVDSAASNAIPVASVFSCS
ncbi:uncharacterized protein LOC114373048 [Glycine soja]|nr:uncharacterized protein LOC114373048 [Glycine soja]